MRGTRNHGSPTWLIAAAALWSALGSGCGSGRTVLVADDSPIRVGPGTTGPAYQLIDGEWVLGSEPISYPEGWYVVPPRFVEPDDLE